MEREAKLCSHCQIYLCRILLALGLKEVSTLPSTMRLAQKSPEWIIRLDVRCISSYNKSN
jgi:hypothetical protein